LAREHEKPDLLFRLRDQDQKNPGIYIKNSGPVPGWMSDTPDPFISTGTPGK
jgi:hypothetical protein